MSWRRHTWGTLLRDCSASPDILYLLKCNYGERSAFGARRNVFCYSLMCVTLDSAFILRIFPSLVSSVGKDIGNELYASGT